MDSTVDANLLHEQDPSESIDSDNSDSHEDSGSGTSTSNNHTDPSGDDGKGIDLLFMKREEAHVRKARLLLLGMTLVCAVTVTVAVYFSASKNEYQSFEEEVRTMCWNIVGKTCYSLFIPVCFLVN